ncbi:hypothetical protein HHUSO_G30352 [Huso huso]|uniref:SWIM-type domain-containing protein n=1 Tax=Huso huso TaxID=61971 RepID=A0ABR0YEN2_HUSHU
MSAEWYTVDLGDEDRFPFCECVSFKSTLLPCKHLFAIFKHTDHSWEALCPAYRDSPYLTLDTDFLSSQALQKCQIVHEDTMDAGNDEVSVSEEERTVHCSNTLSEPIIVGLASTQSFLREKLKVLQDASYLCVNVDALRNAATVVDDLSKKLKDLIPKDNSLPLDSNQGDVSKKQHRAFPKRSKKEKPKAGKKRG